MDITTSHHLVVLLPRLYRWHYYRYCTISIYLVWPCDCDCDTFDGFSISVGTFRCHDNEKISAELELVWHGFGAHLRAKGH